MKNLNQDELGVFVSASIFTAIDSMGIEIERLFPVQLDITKRGVGVAAICHIKGQSVQEWYFSATQTPEKIIKECILLVEEIDNHRHRWIEDFEDNETPELNYMEHPGNY